VCQELLLRNEYLAAENRILKTQLKTPLRLTDEERITFAEIAYRLGRKALEDVANAAKPGNSHSVQASAVLYSLVEFDKANGLTPFDYTKHLLDELPMRPDSLDHLLPWTVELPQIAE